MGLRPKLVDISAAGDHVVIRSPKGLKVVSVRSKNKASEIPIDGPIQTFAISSQHIFVIASGCVRVFHVEGKELSLPERLEATAVRAAKEGQAWIASPAGWQVIQATGSAVTAESTDFTAEHDVIPLDDGTMVWTDGQEIFQHHTLAGAAALAPIGEHVKLEHAANIFNNRLLCLVLATADHKEVLVLRKRAVIHKLTFADNPLIAISPGKSVAFVVTPYETKAIDLQYAKTVNTTPTPLFAEEFYCSRNGKQFAMAGFADETDDCPLTVISPTFDDFFAQTDDDDDDDVAPDLKTSQKTRPAQSVAGADEHLDVWVTSEDSQGPAAPTVNGDFLRRLDATSPARVSSDGTERWHYARTEWLRWAMLLTGRCVVSLRDSGILGDDQESKTRVGKALTVLASETIANESEQFDAFTALAQKAAANIAALEEEHDGDLFVLSSIKRRFQLDEAECAALALACCQELCSELSVLLSQLGHGSMLTGHHLASILECCGFEMQRAAGCISPDSALVANGIVFINQTARVSRLGATIRIPQFLITALWGKMSVLAPSFGVSHAPLADEILSRLASFLQQDYASPARLVLRGRHGDGRVSVITSVTSELKMMPSIIDCNGLAKGKALAAALNNKLLEAHVLGHMPVITNLETAFDQNASCRSPVMTILDTHPGPLAIATSPEHSVPLSLEHLDIALPFVGKKQRADLWKASLEAHNLQADAGALAERFLVGAGTIDRTCTSTSAQAAGATASVERSAQQHLRARATGLVEPVKALPTRQQVALADEVDQRIRELMGRIKHNNLVNQKWGLANNALPGATALFYGPLGTGKSLITALIAHELELELFHVNMPRIISGQSSIRNLERVLDLAMDSKILLLLEGVEKLQHGDRDGSPMNYLLARLRHFRGNAIFTSTDPSIKSLLQDRVAICLRFALPDEALRLRLWRAHLPDHVPQAEDIDLAGLAKRFQLSGGDIRKSVVRAAFIAASQDSKITQAILEFAIEAEYEPAGATN